MIRSTCTALFAFVLVTAFVASPPSSAAKDRYCQPRCRPQPVCCQPRATCCQPLPSCCQSLSSPKSGPYFCGYWKVFDFGSVCYYYAPHCDNQFTPIMLASSCGDPMNPCDDPAGTGASFCIPDGSRFKLAKASTKVHSMASLASKQGQGHNGPSHVHQDFDIKKVRDRMHFVHFVADLPGNPGQDIYAKVAQYDVRYEESENPTHTPLRVAIGHEVRGTPNNAINVIAANVAKIPGNDYAFMITVQVPNLTDPVTFQVFAATDRRN